MSSESVLLFYWPNLKAIVDMPFPRSEFSPARYCAPTDVWITAENALASAINGSERNNPIRRIANLLYGAKLSQRKHAKENPVVAIEHHAEGVHEEAHGTVSCNAVPIATLVCNLLHISFHIIAFGSDPSSKPAALDKHDWIWSLCCFARAASPYLFERAPSPCLLTLEMHCRQSVAVLHWLSFVGPPRYPYRTVRLIRIRLDP
jgi:hypothetical protein